MSLAQGHMVIAHIKKVFRTSLSVFTAYTFFSRSCLPSPSKWSSKMFLSLNTNLETKPNLNLIFRNMMKLCLSPKRSYGQILLLFYQFAWVAHFFTTIPRAPHASILLQLINLSINLNIIPTLSFRPGSPKPVSMPKTYWNNVPFAPYTLFWHLFFLWSSFLIIKPCTSPMSNSSSFIEIQHNSDVHFQLSFQSFIIFHYLSLTSEDRERKKKVGGIMRKGSRVNVHKTLQAMISLKCRLCYIYTSILRIWELLTFS